MWSPYDLISTNIQNPLSNSVASCPHIIYTKLHQNQTQPDREETIQLKVDKWQTTAQAVNPSSLLTLGHSRANKKLSCRGETVRRFVSFSILLSHSKSFALHCWVGRMQVSISTALKLCLYVAPFPRYSVSKNGVTLKLGYGSFNVIENGAVR